MFTNKYMKKVKGSDIGKGENCACKFWKISHENTKKKKYTTKTYGDEKLIYVKNKRN